LSYLISLHPLSFILISLLYQHQYHQLSDEDQSNGEVKISGFIENFASCIECESYECDLPYGGAIGSVQEDCEVKEPEKKKGFPSWAIAVIVVGALLIVAVIVIIILCIIYNKVLF
jgi:cytoskeletal protein RodZ